jgi:hypothetical protein
VVVKMLGKDDITFGENNNSDNLINVTNRNLK